MIEAQRIQGERVRLAASLLCSRCHGFGAYVPDNAPVSRHEPRDYWAKDCEQCNGTGESLR